MLAPKFLMEKFAPGMAASVWFRSNTSQGAMRGRVVGWEEHHDLLSSYLFFELVAGDVMCLPVSDIYLSTLSEERYQAAQADAKLEDRMRAVGRQATEEKLRQHESGLTSLSPR